MPSVVIPLYPRFSSESAAIFVKAQTDVETAYSNVEFARKSRIRGGECESRRHPASFHFLNLSNMP